MGCLGGAKFSYQRLGGNVGETGYIGDGKFKRGKDRNPIPLPQPGVVVLAVFGILLASYDSVLAGATSCLRHSLTLSSLVPNICWQLVTHRTTRCFLELRVLGSLQPKYGPLLPH